MHERLVNVTPLHTSTSALVWYISVIFPNRWKKTPSNGAANLAGMRPISSVNYAIALSEPRRREHRSPLCAVTCTTHVLSGDSPLYLFHWKRITCENKTCIWNKENKALNDCPLLHSLGLPDYQIHNVQNEAVWQHDCTIHEGSSTRVHESTRWKVYTRALPAPTGSFSSSAASLKVRPQAYSRERSRKESASAFWNGEPTGGTQSDRSSCNAQEWALRCSRSWITNPCTHASPPGEERTLCSTHLEVDEKLCASSGVMWEHMMYTIYRRQQCCYTWETSSIDKHDVWP